MGKELFDWVFGTLSAAGVITLAAFLFRETLSKWLTSGVQHSFDKKLAELNGRIKDKQEQIDAMRSGALSVLSRQHENLNDRVLVACERLWEAVQHDKQCDVFLSMISRVNLRKTMEMYNKNDADSEKIKEFFNGLWGESGIEDRLKEKKLNVSLERLFLPDDIYVAYSAYTAISGHIILAISTMRFGTSTDLVKEKNETAEQIKKVLPHQAENIDKFALETYYLFREEIETIILRKLTDMLFGNERALKVVQGSADIINQARMAEINSKVTVPEAIKNAVAK